jgi:hypothetical protein
MSSMTAEVGFEGMPTRSQLCRSVVDGRCIVGFANKVLYRFDEGDKGMRNLAIVSLTDSGVPGLEVAALFGIRPEHVSRLRTKAATQGSAGLVVAQGRPPKLSGREVAKVLRLARAGVSGADIATELGVSGATISRVLAKHGPVAVQATLQDEGAGGERERGGSDEAGEGPAPTDDEGNDEDSAAARGGAVALRGEQRHCRYAGAMLLHPFLESLGAASVFAATRPRRGTLYDDAAVLGATTLGFALGVNTVEGTKHLARGDAGALVGLSVMPELRTLRPRLIAIAERVDPLAIQRAFAKAMLADAESEAEAETQVYFVDDHFAAYSGSRPVAKGWNTKRRHAQPGRDDTVVTDLAGRGVCFRSGEPSGLSKNLPGVIEELRAICGPEARLMVGFDRGGSYPVVFSGLRTAGVDWVSYRRAPLVPTEVAPRRSWVALDDGARRYYRVADEMVDLPGYGPARQLSVFEGDAVVFQVLTSQLSMTPARLVQLLRCRWRIENAFKYLVGHYGIDSLCDYRMDIGPDGRAVRNPARTEATTQRRMAEAALAEAERDLGALRAATTATEDYLAECRRLGDEVAMARDDCEEARASLKGIPAKVAATEVDSSARLARPRLERRSLQMVLRLLAYNAELDLATRLNAYLGDPDEYRAITRHLLHLGGSIHYGVGAVTVTLDVPHQPRVARALRSLVEDLNAGHAHVLADPRPITYTVKAS